MKMLLRRKLPLIVVVVVAVTIVINLTNTYFMQREALTQIKQTELGHIVHQLEIIIQQKAKLAAAQADLIANLPDIREAFRHGDREYLKKHLLQLFEKQKSVYNISEMTFSTPPATSFLRLSHPEAAPEDLSSFRFMIAATNKTQSTQMGAELGREGVSIRGISPIADEKGHIGAFGVGINIKVILEQVREISNVEIGSFIDEELFNTVAKYAHKEITTEIADSRNLVGSYRYMYATNRELIHSIITPELFLKTSTYTDEAIVKGLKYSRVIIPFYDYKNSKIGFFVIAKEFSKLESTFQRNFFWDLTMKLLQLIVITVAILIVFNGFLVSPLSELAQRCHRISQGKKVSLAEFVERKDEIGMLACTIDKLITKPSRSADQDKET